MEPANSHRSPLLRRAGPRPPTQQGMPHTQIGVTPVGGPIYRVGFALLDLEDPTIVLRRSDEWVFGPHEPDEFAGDVNHVVFPCGWIVDELRDEVRMYYGAADTRIGLATARFSAVLDHVHACPGGQQRRRGDPSELVP